MSLRITLQEADVESLIGVLDHVIGQAGTTGQSSYGIDVLCRKDSARNWRRIRALLSSYVGEKKT